jgi:hypothetical protein
MRARSVVAAALAIVAAGCADPQPCPTPLESCGGVCFDLESDRLHCGGCANVCTAGLACSGGRCVTDPAAACPVRIGGWIVTLGACGSTVKLWVSNAEFITRATALVATPGTGASVPVLDLRAGTDCDGQWAWSAVPDTASFATAGPVTAPSCDVCPEAVEALVASAGRWCPSAATVLAVDPR